MPPRAPALLLVFLALLAPATALAARAKPPKPPRPLTEALHASACTECPTGRPDVAGRPSADFLVGWGAGNAFRAFHRLVDANGNGGADHEVSSASTQFYGVEASTGGWLFGYHKPGAQVFLQRLDGNANATGEPLRVNPEPGGDEHGSMLAVSADRVLVTTDRNSAQAPSQLIAHLFDADLQWIAGPIEMGPAIGHVATSACFQPSGTAVLGWNLGQGIAPGVFLYGTAMRRLGEDGTPLGDVRTLAPVGLARYTTTTVACMRDGSFVVAWPTDEQPQAKVGFDVVWQWFDAAGKPRGKVVMVNATRGGDQVFPNLLVVSDGTLLAVWQSEENGNVHFRGRRFAANGRPRGAEFLLHTTTLEAAPFAQPRLSLLPGTGRFVLSWLEGGRGWFRVFAE